jgi:hypothetical protein
VASLAASRRAKRVLVLCLLAVLPLLASVPSEARAARPAPYSAHSMIYTCCTPYELKERMFSEARAMGSSYIRLDVEIGPIFEHGSGWRQHPDWSKLDHVVALSRRYRLPVVGVLRDTPKQLSTCPKAADPGKCAPSDYGRYGRMAGSIAARTRGVIRHWEVLNEPAGSWAFQGTAAQYAWMLRRTYDSIKDAAPEDQVLLGAVTSAGPCDWLRRVFATPGADARHRFNLANVHLRGTIDSLSWAMASFREFFASQGFRGPLWVTEHGYAGDTRFQRDPGYRGGERAQARYLRQALPTFVRAGAGQVFVTLRDSTPAEFGDNEFASEGVLRYANPSPYAVRRKPAFNTVRWVAGTWPTVPATRRDLAGWRRRLVEHSGLARRYRRLNRQALRRVRRYRRRARRATRARLRRRYRRLATTHRRKARGYAKRARQHRKAASFYKGLIAGYREGP